MTTEDVIKAIKQIEQGKDLNEDRVKLFKDKYLSYERPCSAELIVNRVIKPTRAKHFGYSIGEAIKNKIYDENVRKLKEKARPIIKKVRRINKKKK